MRQGFKIFPSNRHEHAVSRGHVGIQYREEEFAIYEEAQEIARAVLAQDNQAVREQVRARGCVFFKTGCVGTICNGEVR